MTQYVDIIGSWKDDLSSKSSIDELRALVEIIDIIEETSKEKAAETSLEIFVNRDICHFLCELISIESLHKTQLVNQILCYLSESPCFYENEVFRILKFYLRLLNTAADSNELIYEYFEYINDCIKFISLILMRACDQEINFTDNRFSIQQLLSTTCKLSKDLFKLPSGLTFIHQVAKIMSLVLIEKDNNRQSQLRFLIEIMRNWKLTDSMLTIIINYTKSTDTVYNLTKYLMHSNNNFPEDSTMMFLIMEKVLRLLEFVTKLKEKDSNQHLKVFCNFLFRFLQLIDDCFKCKLKVLNLFFKNKGHTLALNNINDLDTEKSKRMRFVFGEVLSHYMKLFIHFDEAERMNMKRQGFYKTLMKQSHDVIYILHSYFNLKFNYVDSKNELLSDICDSIFKFSAEKEIINKNCYSMLLSIFAECFVPKSREKKSILQASSILKQRSNNIKPLLSDDYIRWWNYSNHNKIKEYEKLIHNRVSMEFFEVKIKIYDHKYLLKLFFDEKSENCVRLNSLKVLSMSLLNLTDIRKLITRLEDCIKHSINVEVCGILLVLIYNCHHFNERIKKSAALSTKLILNKNTGNCYMRFCTLNLCKFLIYQFVASTLHINKIL